jgi:hypothetical protein
MYAMFVMRSEYFGYFWYTCIMGTFGEVHFDLSRANRYFYFARLILPLTSYFPFIFSNSTINSAEKTLTVVFHAILSKEFKRDEDTKIVIRGKQPIFPDDWHEGGVPVSTKP